MSYCACSTWPEYSIRRADGSVRIVPAGTVDVLRPSGALVAALVRANRAAALDAAALIGIQPPVAGPLWDAMAARTETEAVRVIAERDIVRLCGKRGVARTTVSDVSLSEEVGLLDPDPPPATRRFRDCWRRAGMSLPGVDMPLARLQRMSEVRTARAPKLTKSDVDLLKAQEAADVSKQVALRTYRQQLRDLPATEQPNVNALATPEQLAAWRPMWPVDPAP